MQQETQILLVTHSTTLAEAISSVLAAQSIQFVSVEGTTRREIEGSGPKVWVFNNDNDNDDHDPANAA